ncbi:hypothetical protein D1007_45809 [Hordeum vulgare]|uniref:Predicted protein n=1 Tax=Hordeum vulgare subsp. vulgare TaxID=112509 RepID=F2E3U5_HORVV|nr:uncharacterized protein LOC123446566 [Hordeum vulgare subsp. vulgare]KAE8781002.1 hypothetical protein D1007_45809 [Hordeum vulgare]KAI4967677.1 hypothetical protein ZWY2020_019663 [Hordeum vulgare]KAI4994519.1 hypothetical protein ZWY2020_034160 [Hordeum vulgare]BAK02017.1 predicted protein [Hordeum vulgare subsp. vulgare]
MGLPARLSRRLCGFAVLCLCLRASSCNQDVAPIEPLPASARSLQCFEDGQVYGCCEGAYRLDPSGIIGVPLGAVDYYCGGACVVETEDVLNCVASALDGFRFHNGASVEDARYALRRGCSHTIKRGDFNALEPPMGDYPDIYGDYRGDGRRATAPRNINMLAFLGAAWLLLIQGR